MAPKYQKIDAWKLREGLRCPICITTNGYVTHDGKCVMGRGIAKQASERYPELAKALGTAIKKNGNVCQPIKIPGKKAGVIAFPVKPGSKLCNSKDEVVSHMRNRIKVGDLIPGWACLANLELIRTSCIQLNELLDEYNLEKVILNFPGIGAGFLDPKDVKKILDELLDERVVVVYK